ncbi:hypothetical protein ABK040_010395 [Willaertia magna]
MTKALRVVCMLPLIFFSLFTLVRIYNLRKVNRDCANDKSVFDKNIREDEETFLESGDITKSIPSIMNTVLLKNRYITSLKKELNQSNIQCTRYKDSITPFKTCKFNNICMNQQGEWILFVNDFTFSIYKRFNKRVWVDVQGRSENGRGFMKINLVKREDIVNYEIDKDFTFYEGTTFPLVRYAAGNVGHILMENVLPVFKNMMQYESVNLNNRFLFLDDVFDKRSNGEIAAYGYDLENTEKYSKFWFSIMSKYSLIQKCEVDNGKYYIKPYPCRNKVNEEENNEDKKKIVACFDTLIAGFTNSFLLDFNQKEFIVPYYRRFIHDSFMFNNEEKGKKELWLAIHEKPLDSPLGYTISNVNEVIKYFEEHSNEDKVLKSNNYKIKVITLRLEDMNFNDQIIMFSRLDGFITTPGSASYMSIFMPEGSWLFYSSNCQTKKEIKEHYFCEEGFGKTIHSSFPHLNYYSLQPHVKGCNARYLEKRPLNCDTLYDVGSLYTQVMARLKSNLVLKYSN